MPKAPAMFWFALGVGGVALFGAWLATRQVSAAIEAAAPKLTPASPENVVYKDIVGGVGRTLAQDQNWTLGGWFRDLVSDDDEKIRAMLDGAPSSLTNAQRDQLYG